MAVLDKEKMPDYWQSHIKDKSRREVFYGRCHRFAFFAVDDRVPDNLRKMMIAPHALSVLRSAKGGRWAVFFYVAGKLSSEWLTNTWHYIKYSVLMFWHTKIRKRSRPEAIQRIWPAAWTIEELEELEDITNEAIL